MVDFYRLGCKHGRNHATTIFVGELHDSAIDSDGWLDAAIESASKNEMQAVSAEEYVDGFISTANAVRVEFLGK